LSLDEGRQARRGVGRDHNECLYLKKLICNA
jgi:hypothetical protein